VGGHIFFAGVVAGVRYVTVRTGDGWKVTFGRLAASPLERGDFVLPGAVIGTAGDNLFMSLRKGQTPYNPALMYPRRAILLP
jgi:septal ring factor EnvC (AmiA/AmiB activator)